MEVAAAARLSREPEEGGVHGYGTRGMSGTGEGRGGEGAYQGEVSKASCVTS